jgi:zinc and cadmium transporter
LQSSCNLFFYLLNMELTPFMWTLLGNVIVAIWIITVILLAKYIIKSLNNYLEYITATTVWLLLWIIFLGFIPRLNEGFEENWMNMWIFILIWIFLFYTLELFLHWHHCKDLGHESSCWHAHDKTHKSWALMFGWTLLHNMFHWVVLFSAFAVDFHFWIATTIAVLLHSIPQNIVNYVMNNNNSKYAYIAAFGWIFWALLTFPFSEFLTDNKFYFLAIIAWGLLYTALADIFPEFKWKWTTSKKISYFIFIIIGLALFLGFESISEHSHSHWHESSHNEKYHEHEKEHLKDNH